jgi:hypothetical protein
LSRTNGKELDGGHSHQGSLGFGQCAGDLLVGLDVADQILPEFGIEFLGPADISERGG